LTHPVAEDVGPMTLTGPAAPDGATIVALGTEPLTYSPVVAATARRLRRLFPAGPRPAMG
jgi:hypothetical protein